MYREKSYVFKDKNLLTAILESEYAINDEDMSPLVLDHVLNHGGHAGKVFGSMYGIGEANWSNLPTIQSICEDETACSAVFNHDVATSAILGYNNYEIMSYKSDVLYTILNTKPDIITNIINSDFYKTKIQSNKTTSYNDYCILTTCISNIGQIEQVYQTDAMTINVKSYCKTGLKYTNIDNTITVLCKKEGTGSTGGVIGLKNPYNVTNYTVNKIVKNVVIEPGYYNHNSNSEYNAISTSTGVISYIPL